MKSHLQKIEIQNFKAFRKFSLNLEGRHLLLYGANGSGKSSLYWALYTFLQSAGKQPQGAIAKYFLAGGPESLLNTHEQDESTPRQGQLSLTLRETATKTDTTYRISEADHGTHNVPAIVKANLASDFITYRFFFGFSNFKNSVRFDLWPLFETEILPFCVRPGAAQSPIQQWRRIRSENPNPCASRGTGGADAYASFQTATEQFAITLKSVIRDISHKAQEFYQEHFSSDDVTPIQLMLGITRPPSFSGTNQQNSRFRKPILELHLKVGSNIIKRPQSYLNEAKMTQVALSVRLAASLVNLQENEQDYLKLLVLDDLLVSLDMDNRMKVVEILLSETFANYQKIILTHDRGFFEEFKRMIGTSHGAWCFRSLQGNPKDGITDKLEKTPTQKAVDYMKGHDLDAAAVQLRKTAEETAQSYLKRVTGKKLKPDEFRSLGKMLEKARNILLNDLPLEAFKNVCKNVPEGLRGKILRINDDDINADETLTPEEKELLKEQRSKLKGFMTNSAWKSLESIEVLEEVILMKDRIFNPGAHWNETPLYLVELKKALSVIERFEASFKS